MTTYDWISALFAFMFEKEADNIYFEENSYDSDSDRPQFEFEGQEFYVESIHKKGNTIAVKGRNKETNKVEDVFIFNLKEDNTDNSHLHSLKDGKAITFAEELYQEGYNQIRDEDDEESDFYYQDRYHAHDEEYNMDEYFDSLEDAVAFASQEAHEHDGEDDYYTMMVEDELFGETIDYYDSIPKSR